MHNLTVSSTAASLGLPNQPTRADHKANLRRLQTFLGKIPFPITVTSAYRSPAVNTAIGGSPTSQHSNGLAVDFSTPGMSNRQVAAWFYKHRAEFPELDQVIWYPTTTHVHVGICPPGATGCVRGAPRGQFLVDKGGSWVPTSAQIAQVIASPPVRTGLKFAGIYFATSAAISLIGLAVAYRYRDELRQFIERA